MLWEFTMRNGRVERGGMGDGSQGRAGADVQGQWLVKQEDCDGGQGGGNSSFSVARQVGGYVGRGRHREENRDERGMKWLTTLWLTVEGG